MRVLLVEDNDGDADLVADALSGAVAGDVELSRADRISSATAQLAAKRFDVVLLDLSLPDATGMEGLHTLRSAAPGATIVVLTGSLDGAAGTRAIQQGAQDFLLKGDVKSGDLLRALRFARERADHAHRAQVLAEVSAALGSSLDPERMIEALRATLTGGFADACAVSGIRTEGAELGRMRLESERAPSRRAARLHPSLASADVQDRTQVNAWMAEGLTSVISVPFSVEGWRKGELTLGRNAKSTPYGLVDFALAEEITRRAASAIEHASLLACALRERERAEVAIRFRDEFLATLSHELRTPLNAILGWAQMLRTGKVAPGAQDRALETIERNAMSQVALVEDILDVSRIITGKLRLHVAPAEVDAVVRSAVETCRPSASAKGITVAVMIAEGLPTIHADADRLLQVLWNLLSNAVKFTPRGGTIKVVVCAAVDGVEVTVTDSGAGIEPSFLPYLFERFRQSDTSITRSSNGLGLGLAISRHLAEAHGGTLEATSPGVGKGASFVLRVPARGRAPVESAHQRSRVPRPLSVSSGLGLLGGYRIVIVEDDEDSRELLTVFLESRGARVRGGSSAEEGLALVQSETPDLIISDIGMPNMSGFEFIRRSASS